MTDIVPEYTDYAELRDGALPYLPTALYQRWQKYGDITAIMNAHGNSISYRQLVCEVEHKYASIRQENMQPGDVVALCGEITAEMIATLLASWLLGLTVTLLDDNLPPARREKLLTLAAPRLLVHQDDKSAEFPGIPCRRYVELSGMPVSIIGDAQPEAAYIVFTSGSTGEPKAILGSHSGLSHFICWQSQTFRISTADRFAQLTAVGFDVIFRSVLTPLFAGAQLWLPPHSVSDGNTMLTWLRYNRISALHLVPSITKTWLAQCPHIDLPHLRWIFSAGEMLHGKVLDNIYQQWGFRGQVVNLYGPSETTLAKCFYRCQANDGFRYVLPVGIPLPNTEIWIMDGERFCAPEETGEVVFRTPYRAQGYLGDAPTTFQPTPGAANPHDQLYYTGDIGHVDDTGLLHLHGRRDDQIKINGVRIEPGEIESFLHNQPQVHDVTVCYHDGLVAYLAGTETLSIAKIDVALQQAFPAVMQPRLVLCQHLPKNTNGKTDRQALLQMQQNSDSESQPKTELERQLHAICLDIIGRNRMGMNEDLRSAGLQSLQFLVLLSKLQQTFTVALTLHDLYQQSSLEALAQLITQRQPAGLAEIPQSPREQTVFPASRAQQRLYALDTVEQCGNAYNICSAWILHGVDPVKFKTALTATFTHYPILRTGFQLTEGRLEQHIMPDAPLPLWEDEITPQQITETLEALNAPFDLHSPPLVRFGLFTLPEPDSYLFAWSIHHTLFDGPSRQLLLNSLWQHYANPALSMTPALHYHDYASFEAQQGMQWSDNLAYWQEALGTKPPLLNLSTDRPRSPQKYYRGAVASTVVPKDTVALLTRQLEGSTITRFQLLLATFGLLMGRYARQQDILLGVPVNGRTHPALQSLTGMFAESLPVILSTMEQLSVAEYLLQVQQRIQQAQAHACPLEEIIKVLALPRNASRSPLFDVMFSLAEPATTCPDECDIRCQPYDFHPQTAKFDLLAEVEDRGDTITLRFEYDSTLFDHQTVQRMLQNYLTLLTAILEADEQTPLAQLNGICTTERQQLLDELASTPFPLPRDKYFLDYFYAQCLKAPGAVAVVGEDKSLTYRELDKASEHLAWQLHEEGVRAHDVVAIISERNSDVVVAILALLKLNAVYLPVDPATPDARIAYMLSDSLAVHILAQPALHERLTTLAPRAKLVDIRSDETGPSISVPARIKGDDPCVIFYTSGSTGNPKGVTHSHLGLLNFALYENEQNDLQASDKVAFYASLAFDVSMWSLLLPLLRGATVHVLPESSRYALENIHQYFEQHGITVALFPTQLCEAFMQHPASSTLRLVWTAGEKLQQVPDTLNYRVINGYGPTEYTGCTTRYEVTTPLGDIPIGRPLGNTWVYILDDELDLLPLGVAGELCIAGLQMTQGYLNQSEQTAARYVANPYACGPDNTLLYRTGDIARWQPDGNLAYLGRKDDQVKIRGFRVEPQEVEQALLAQPAIEQATVLAVDDGQGRYKLVAYLATKMAHSLKALHEVLRHSLPEYMLPSHCLCLPSLPLTANGKVDKTALKSLSLAHTDTPFAAPACATEKRIAALWQKLLAVENIGRDDDFFSLGGNSITALMMGAELNRSLGKSIPLKGLFQFSQLATFSRYVDGIEGDSTTAQVTALSHDSTNAYQPFGLTDVQRAYLIGRESAFELGGVTTHVYREDRFAELDVTRLTAALNQLVQRHPALRTLYSLEGTQRILNEVPAIEILVQDLRNQPVECQRAALLRWREELEQQKFDAATFPLFEFRVTHHRGNCVLHFSFDALIMDALSMRIFMRELGELYRHPQKTLPALNITFRDYQLAYEQLKTTERYQVDKTYWHQRLPELPYGPALSTTCRPDTIHHPAFARQSVSLPPEVWQKLQARIRQAKISPTVPFLTLYGQVLARWSTSDHFLINLTLFQREDLHPDISHLLGDFTVLSLFEYRRQQNSLSQTLQSIQTQLWDDLAHTLFTGLEVQSALTRQHQRDGDKPIAPVVLTSLLGIPLNDENFLSEEYLGRDYARTQTSQVWLDNKIYEKDGGLIIEWDYVSQLFTEQQISDMLNAYRQAIVDMTEGGWEQPLHIPLPAVDNLLLQQYNATDDPRYMPAMTLPVHFLQTARTFPYAPAVITAQESVNYRELAASAAQLAHTLKSNAVVRHERVLLCAEKGASLVSGALGIMMANAVFVPVNIEWPVARLRDIVAQAGIHHILITCKQYQRLQQEGGLGAGMVYHLIDEKLPTTSGCITPVMDLLLDDPAYVIFTSGSTGKPKGVCISHRGVMNTLLDINQRLAATADDRTLSLSNISFDLAIYDIFSPLLLGGAVVMPHESALKQPGELLKLLDDNAVTICNSTPAIMALLVQSASGYRYSHLRHVLLSGDFIPLDLPAQVQHTFPSARLLSLGGATEGSIWSICYPVSDVNPHWTSIPYGMPLANQQVWVLDAERQPCPVDVAGEIYLAGCGVALGYEADAEKTAAHFGQLPSGLRYYRTGDQGVMRREGYIEILGRLDHQVKINGFRIELGEIDSVLQSHPAVQTTLTRIIAQDNTQKTLATYVVPKVFDHLAFRLEKRGLRKDATDLGINLEPLTSKEQLASTAQQAWMRKSYRHYQPDSLTLEVLLPLLLTPLLPSENPLVVTANLSWSDLAVLLTPLRALEHPTDGLKKYRYPSAGGLYPVRTYLTLSRAFGKHQGHYYYHPEKHALIPISVDGASLPETGIGLQLNAWLPAIEPEYHQHAITYCRLEAGCMQALLEAHCHLESVATQPVGGIDELPLAAYRLENAPLNIAASGLPDNTLLLLKTLNGWESHCLKAQRFRYEGSIPLTFSFDQGEHNEAILSQAGALLLLPDIPGVEQGRLTQRVSEQLLKASLGSCLLGQLSLEDQLPAYACQRTFSGALAIGKINHDAMMNGEPEHVDSATTPSLAETLRNYLLQRLPNYMVPQDIFCLPELPLTPNGKVDIKSLPQSQTLYDLDDVCQPRDQYEERLLELWNDVLPLANVNNIHADFFACGGNSLDAILLSIKMSQRFVRKIPTALVYKHRTIAQQANAIIECVLKPTEDFIVLNKPDTPKPKRLILFPTSDSGAEAYHQLAQALAEDIEVIGVSHFLINYPEKVTSDWSIALDFYCQQVENIVSQAPEQPVWLGGWSLGGNIAIAVAERLTKSCPQIRHQLIIFDSLPVYNTVEREVRENTTDEWSSYHPDNIMYRQFMMAGYSRRHYFHFVDCQFDHLSAMQVTQSSQSILLIKCMVPIGYFYSDIPDNGWGAIAKSVTVYRVEAHHINLLIDNEMIRQVAEIIRQTLNTERG